ncbi:MAG TPA: DNA-binding response regulator, partial [Planctomycetaceae bacterium]|nr:DNA-binding response regulator [Planctomycetaceae bacterium]
LTRPIGSREQFGNVRVDFERFEVTRGDQQFSLTTREMELLRYFLEHEDVVLSRGRLQTDVWQDSVEWPGRSIDNFVMRLRKMIETDSASPRHLISIRGTGYRFIRNPEN